jgi:hypothetical protein
VKSEAKIEDKNIVLPVETTLFVTTHFCQSILYYLKKNTEASPDSCCTMAVAMPATHSH